MKAELFSTLVELSGQKIEASHGNEALDPFMKESFTMKGTFVTSSKTFASRYDKNYEDGQTIIALIGEDQVEVAILIHPDKNWTDDHVSLLPMSSGENFEVEVNLLGFNALHQRVTFGEVFPEKLKGPTSSQVYTGDDSSIVTNLPREGRERPKARRSRRRNRDRDEDSKEREGSKFLFTPSQSNNLGCRPRFDGSGSKHLWWFLILMVLSLVGFIVGHIIGIFTKSSD
jgi:hypothetical protein